MLSSYQKEAIESSLSPRSSYSNHIQSPSDVFVSIVDPFLWVKKLPHAEDDLIKNIIPYYLGNL
jgi:hypothetical protein